MSFRSDIPGWLHPNEVSSIQRICKLVPVGKNILEIGPFAGRTTIVLAESCPHSDIYTIDPWRKSDNPASLQGMPNYTGAPDVTANDAQDIFRREVLQVYPRVKPIRGEFPKDLPSDLGNFGLIYWDTDSYSSSDSYKLTRELFNAYRKVEIGGILAGHTFAWWMPNVVNVVRNLAMRMEEDVILPPSGSIWYIRRTKN